MNRSDHINQMNANDKLINELLFNKTKFFDWIIIVMFYAGLHKIDYLLHQKNINKLYVQFFMKLIAECRLPVNDINSHRNVDRALWSCGKYLKAKRDIKRLTKKWREYTRSNSS